MRAEASGGNAAQGGRIALLILLVYLALWAMAVLAADPSCHQVGAVCANTGDRYGSWLSFHLLDGKWFDEDPRQPEYAFTEMPPGHAFWLAGIFTIFGRSSFLPAVALQALGLCVAALFARRAMEKSLPGLGNPTLALLLLNPNVIAQTALSQADCVFMIAAIAILTLVLHYLNRPALGVALATGLTVGVSAMIKVPGQYVMILLPIALPLLVALSPEPDLRQARPWRFAFAHGVAAALVAAVVVSPWAYHMWRAGEGVTLQNRGILALVLEDGSKYLGDRPLVLGDRATYRQLEATFESESTARREAELAARHPGFKDLPLSERNRLRRDWMIDLYLEFPGGVPVFLRALVLSWARALLPGGEGEWHRLFGIEAQPEKSPSLFYGIKGIALSLTLASRILAVLGIFALFVRRRYDLLVLTVCWIGLFTGLTALVGNTRYRLPMELPLAMLAAAGWLYLQAWWRARASSRPVGHIS